MPMNTDMPTRAQNAMDKIRRRVYLSSSITLGPA